MEYYYVHEEGDHLETCFRRRHCPSLFNMPSAAALLLPIEVVVSWMTSGDGGPRSEIFTRMKGRKAVRARTSGKITARVSRDSQASDTSWQVIDLRVLVALPQRLERRQVLCSIQA
eukprot:FR738653.1.p1 GENE.FR738653.1~~FR738653.1.p1  ORF type:complete len:116 (+),score=0.04 FR738653.1:300-647(+)